MNQAQRMITMLQIEAKNKEKCLDAAVSVRRKEMARIRSCRRILRRRMLLNWQQTTQSCRLTVLIQR